MEYVATLAMMFVLIQFIVSGSNFFFRVRLNEKPYVKGKLVSVLIPARNEEANIGNILSDLIQLPYQNIEIIVFNDQSTDNTVSIVESYRETDSRIKLVNSEGLPQGWLGKNFACHKLAENAAGEYYLFLDADVRIKGNVIQSVREYAQEKSTDLVSIFPVQIMDTLGEKLTVPNMKYILLSLLPLPLVLKLANESLSAANGQFMFFTAETYKEIQPHSKVRSNRAEDIEIARMYKKQGRKVACLTGIEDVKCRMYNNLSDAINGFAKNVLFFFGGSALLAIFYFILALFGVFIVYFGLGIFYLVLYILMLMLVVLFISLVSRQNVLWNLLFYLPVNCMLGVLIFKALKNKSEGKLLWKGRSI